MMMDIEALAQNLTAQYPAGVQAVRFRDMEWREQLRVLSQTKVFITTQGSSAFRLVFLPPGATCIMIGAPEPHNTSWKSFHELDRWFPLTYVQFLRYEIPMSAVDEYEVKVWPGWWQPVDAEGQKNWWLYNADVRLKKERLYPILESVLSQQGIS
jgi:hypothetical protein